MKLRTLTLAICAGTTLGVVPSALAQSQRQSSQRQNQSHNQRDEQQRDEQRSTGERQSPQRQSQDAWFDDERGSNPGSTSEQSQQRNGQSRQRDSQSNSGDNSQSRTGQDIQLTPQGWITIAADYDMDGRFDGYETIYYYDLEMARERSKQRSRDQQMQRSHQRQRGSQQRMADQSRSDRNSQSASYPSTSSQSGSSDGSRSSVAKRGSVSGELIAIGKMQTPNSSQRKVVAKVKTDRGRTALVCLGPEDKVMELDLQEGDKVNVDGIGVRVDGVPMLLGARVEANGKTMQHKLTRRQGINRTEGEIVNLKDAQSRRGDGTYWIAKVKTDEGTQQIHLGPKRQLSKLDLAEGDDVSIISRVGRVSGSEALIAMRIDANDETVNIVRSTNARNSASQSTRKRAKQESASRERQRPNQRESEQSTR